MEETQHSVAPPISAFSHRLLCRRLTDLQGITLGADPPQTFPGAATPRCCNRQPKKAAATLIAQIGCVGERRRHQAQGTVRRLGGGPENCFQLGSLMSQPARPAPRAFTCAGSLSSLLGLDGRLAVVAALGAFARTRGSPFRIRLLSLGIGLEVGHWHLASWAHRSPYPSRPYSTVDTLYER